jgi:NitT/TauT family transport system permease protein
MATLAADVPASSGLPTAPRATAGATLARRLLLPLGVIAALIALWDVAIRIFDVPAYMIPAPGAVWQALVKERARLADNAIPTVLESLGGFALGNLVAIAAAVAFVHNKALERALYPVAVAVRTLPIVAIAPILVLMLGNGYAPKVVIAALITFFPTLVNMVEGLESADPQAMELMHVLSAREPEVFRYVRWPSSLPYLFSAMRIASISDRAHHVRLPDAAPLRGDGGDVGDRAGLLLPREYRGVGGGEMGTLRMWHPSPYPLPRGERVSHGLGGCDDANDR